MKHPWLLIVFYCIIHKASGDIAVRYEGMTQNDVTNSIQTAYNVPFTFVDAPTFAAFVAAHVPTALMQVSTPTQTSTQQ